VTPGSRTTSARGSTGPTARRPRTVRPGSTRRGRRREGAHGLTNTPKGSLAHLVTPVKPTSMSREPAHAPASSASCPGRPADQEERSAGPRRAAPAAPRLRRRIRALQSSRSPCVRLHRRKRRDGGSVVPGGTCRARASATPRTVRRRRPPNVAGYVPAGSPAPATRRRFPWRAGVGDHGAAQDRRPGLHVEHARPAASLLGGEAPAVVDHAERRRRWRRRLCRPGWRGRGGPRC